MADYNRENRFNSYPRAATPLKRRAGRPIFDTRLNRSANGTRKFVSHFDGIQSLAS